MCLYTLQNHSELRSLKRAQYVTVETAEQFSQTLFTSLSKGTNLVRDSGLDVWTRLVVWRSKAVTVDRGVGDYCGYETSPGLNVFERGIWLMLQAELVTLWGAAEGPGELKRAMLGWPELIGIQCKAVARGQAGAILKSFPGVRAWNRWCDQRAVAQEKQGGYIDLNLKHVAWEPFTNVGKVTNKQWRRWS